MSCLESPRQPVPDFLNGAERTFNDAETMQPRTPGAIPSDARNGARVKTQDVKPEGFYRPNYNILTPNMRSPDYVQMSTAAAITLGVMSGYMHRTSCTRCLNLLLTYPEGCRANCAYCGLARHREGERNYADRNFIRVDWPAVPYDQVLDIVASGGDGGRFHRMCISMITHPRSDDDTRVVLRKWTERIKHVPVSILSNPTTMTRLDVQELHDLGADIFTVALDACNPEVFDRTRGKRRAVAAQLGQILGNPARGQGDLRAGEIRRPSHRRHGRERPRRADARCRPSATSAATATCSRSSRSRAR